MSKPIPVREMSRTVPGHISPGRPQEGWQLTFPVASKRGAILRSAVDISAPRGSGSVSLGMVII
jgi:hypothetical protein